MISVLCVTNRVGGMDVLFSSLAQQTHQDFEIILVDALFDHRSERDFRHIARELNLSHTPPRDNPFPAVAYCRSMNTAIAHARGETCVLLCDYSWLHSDCLATHAACQAKNPGPLHLDYNYSKLPTLKPDLPMYAQTVGPEHPEYLAQLNATTDRYCSDLASGKLDPFMWSIFAESPTQEMVGALEVTHKHRPCATREAGDWNWCSLKNESFPTELLLDLNGFDEALDASHCYQDLDFSYRLRARGIEWQNGPPEQGMVTVLNPRELINVKRLTRPIWHNRRLVEGKDFSRKVNPEWSLREWRKATVGL